MWPWSIEAARLQGGLRVRPQARLRAARAARDLHGRAGRPPRPSGPGQGLGLGQVSGRGRPGQKTLKDKLGDVQLRLANLTAAAGGLLDGQRLVDASDLLVVSLPTLANKADSEALFRIILSDVGHWITRKGGRPGLVTVDEFGASTAAGEIAVDLLGRG